MRAERVCVCACSLLLLVVVVLASLSAMARLLNKSAESYGAEREQFVRGLRHFHDQKG